MPDPGKFVHRVYIFNPTMTIDAKKDMKYDYNDNNYYNNLTTTPPAPEVAKEIRASIEPLVGRELVVAKGIRADITLKFKSWFTPALIPLSRLYWYNGFKWVLIDIATPVTPDFQNRELWFYGCVTNQ
jgi:hypothetical protein